MRTHQVIATLAGQGQWMRNHQLTPRQLRGLEAEARASGAEALVCTEKDAVKLDGAGLAMPLWVAEQRVAGGEPLVAWVLERLGGFRAR